MKNIDAGLKDDLRQEGYSQEERYFYEVNKELIENQRRRLDEERERKLREVQKTTHWMKCPKCGSDLQESQLLGIRLEQCPSCQGFFLDRGELETLLKAKHSETFIGKLKKIFEPGEIKPGMF